MRNFPDYFSEEFKDVVRLDRFIDEGQWDVVSQILKKYSGRLMEMIIHEERAMALYITLRSMGNNGLAFRIVKEFGISDDKLDSFEREYRMKMANCPSDLIPSARTLRELIVEPL